MTVIFQSTLNAYAEDERSKLNTAARAGIKSKSLGFYTDSFAVTTLKDMQSQLEFIPDDDYFLRELILVKRGAQSGVNLSLTLSCPDDSTYLNDGTLSVTMATTSATEETVRANYDTVTSQRYPLLRGVRYKLRGSGDGTVDGLQGIIVLEHRRRRR